MKTVSYTGLFHLAQGRYRLGKLRSRRLPRSVFWLFLRSGLEALLRDLDRQEQNHNRSRRARKGGE